MGNDFSRTIVITIIGVLLFACSEEKKKKKSPNPTTLQWGFESFLWFETNNLVDYQMANGSREREGMSKGEVGWTGIRITLGVKGKTSHRISYAAICVLYLFLLLIHGNNKKFWVSLFLYIFKNNYFWQQMIF